MKQNKDTGFFHTLRFFRPTIIAAAAVLFAFFCMQGIPMGLMLNRRTDFVSVQVVAGEQSRELTEDGQIKLAVEVTRMLARRFRTTVEQEPDTYYIYRFEDGSQLEVGVWENAILYDGTWYTGAASTPELFRKLTQSRFFPQEAQITGQEEEAPGQQP